MRQHLTKQLRRQFYSPGDFLAECAKYFNWCEENPVLEEQVYMYQGHIIRADKSKMRPFTRKGLASFCNITENALAKLATRDDKFEEAMEFVDQIIYDQKFTGAAAGLLNANIISRDLGLADKQEHTGAGGGPIQTEELSARERVSSRLASLASRSGENSAAEEPE